MKIVDGRGEYERPDLSQTGSSAQCKRYLDATASTGPGDVRDGWKEQTARSEATGHHARAYRQARKNERQRKKRMTENKNERACTEIWSAERYTSTLTHFLAVPVLPAEPLPERRGDVQRTLTG